MQEIVSADGLVAYRQVLTCFERLGQKHNHNYELQDLFVRLPYTDALTGTLRLFLDHLFACEPLRLCKGLKKAERAYARTGDRITKPSYISRVRAFADYSSRTKLVSNIDQIKSVARVFCEEPNASYHVISIFRPIDLLEKFRPGYVPCVICADFKYRRGKLIAKFFFRSCDAYNLLPFDIFYCTAIAEQLIGQIRANGFQKKISLGEIVFWFSRIYVSRFDIEHRKSLLDEIDAFSGRRSSRRPPKIRPLYCPTESPVRLGATQARKAKPKRSSRLESRSNL